MKSSSPRCGFMFSSTLRPSSTNPWDSRRTSCRGLVGCGRRRRDAPGPSVDEIKLITKKNTSQKIGSLWIGESVGNVRQDDLTFFNQLNIRIKSGAGLSSITFPRFPDTHFLNIWPVAETFHMACLNRWLQWKVSGNNLELRRYLLRMHFPSCGPKLQFTHANLNRQHRHPMPPASKPEIYATW